MKKTFYPRFGICWESIDYDPLFDIEIQTDDWAKPEALIMITDPYQRTYFNIATLSNSGEKILLERLYQKVINIKVHIKDITDPLTKGTCENYDSRGNTYQDCVDEKMNEMLSPELGCLPPWLSPRNQCLNSYTGPEFVKFNATLSGHNFTEDIVDPILDMKKTKTELECLSHCLRMENTVSLQWRDKVADKATKVVLQFEKDVVLSKTIVTYFLSDFAIDIGSTLGFWLGLSVFGLTDLVETVAEYAKTIFKRLF